jgi:SAM-dependent methyltransferase
VDPSLFTTFATIERSHWWFIARRRIVMELVGRYLPPGESVVDVGCGTGFILEAAGQRYQAWGVDPSPLAVTMCRERGLDRVAEGSAEDLSMIPKGYFAGVLLLDVLEHLDDDLLALQQARNVLALGGIVFISVPAFKLLWSRHDVVNQHRRRYRLPELEALLADAGFEVLRISYFNTRLFPVAALSRVVFRALGWDPLLQLRVPAPWLNRALARVFEGEKSRLAGPRPRRPYPFGLSILAVARKA